MRNLGVSIHVVLLATMLNACSFYSIGYRFLDTLIQSKVDEIFDLSYSQKQDLYPRIEKLSEKLKPRFVTSLASWLHSVQLSIEDQKLNEKTWSGNWSRPISLTHKFFIFINPK